MPAVSTYTCNKCGYHVASGGPFYFYRDETGEAHIHPHPEKGEDIAKYGIHGQAVRTYCGDCKEQVIAILGEFKTPYRHKVLAGPTPITQAEATCPKCGGDNLLCGNSRGPWRCPRCRKGKLVFSDWMTG